ncbi:MAG: class II glutamine amidotransferase [Oligoflexales bacterium]
MCRLFGFRSITLSQVHKSLISANNALVQQSSKHPDGWGVAYYALEVPHIIKSLTAAINCQVFKKVSAMVSSYTVLAHLRKATVGEIDLVNTHPFQLGHWTFAHNGNCKNFKAVRKDIYQKIDLNLRRYILGETDSELIFFLILSFLAKKHDLDSNMIKLDHLAKAVMDAKKLLVSVAGPLHANDDGDPSEHFLTFIITNGSMMLAHQGGKTLFYSTHKKRCPDRDQCPMFASVCERATLSGKVHHLIFSSEPLQGENVWNPMRFEELIGLDDAMMLRKF